MSHAVLTYKQSMILEALYIRHCGGSSSGELRHPYDDPGMSATSAYAQLVKMGFCRTVTSQSGKRRCHLTESGLYLCKQTFLPPRQAP